MVVMSEVTVCTAAAVSENSTRSNLKEFQYLVHVMEEEQFQSLELLTKVNK